MEAQRSRREFLRDAVIVGAGAALFGAAAPFARSAGGQEAGVAVAAPGALEAPYPGTNPTPFEYSVPMNPYELGGEAGIRDVIDRAKNVGATAVFMGVFWPTVEDREGAPYNLGPLDLAVDEARRRGMKVRLQVSGTPDWVHPWVAAQEPDAGKRVWYPPMGDRELGLWAAFLRRVAERYGEKVFAFTIWNEPNVDSFFKGTQGTPTYAALLRASYDVLKSLPSAPKVVFGGVALNDTGYLDKYYASARALPDAAGKRFYFDELDVRPYATQGHSPDYAGHTTDARGGGPRQLPVMRAAMERNGDGGKEIFCGEFGYPTNAGWYVQPVDDRRRSLFLKQAYSRVREMGFVSGMSWYALHPYGGQGGIYAVSPVWTLLDESRGGTRTFVALAEAIGWYASTKAYPKLPEGGVVSGSWTVQPVFEDGPAPGDVTGYDLYVDGVLKKEAASAPFAFDTTAIPNGSHEVVLAAYTQSRSVYSAEPVVLEFRNAAPPPPPNAVPTISNVRPAPGTATTDRTPVIAATVTDDRTNLSAGNIRVLVDGRARGFSYDASVDRLRLSPTLAAGRHVVRIEATDAQGAVGAFQWSFYVK